MNWRQTISELLGSKHSDSMAIVRAGRRGAKHRSNRRLRAEGRRLAQQMADEDGPVTERELEELRKVWPE